MKVIVAGFSKTGTKSLNSALKTLGYSVYDYLEHGIIHQDEWNKILYNGWTTQDFQQMYENVDAVTDAPAFYFWEEILKAFPEAKIILMIRDEESWYRSFEDQLRTVDQNYLAQLMGSLSPTTRRLVNRVQTRTNDVIYGWDLAPRFRRKFNKQLMLLKYRAHNAYVMQNAPKNTLLIFECSQGWKPLCDFLGMPIPDVEFPHKNKKGDIIQEWMESDPFVKKMQREVFVSLGLITTCIAIGSYYLWTRGPTSLFNSAVTTCKNVANRFTQVVNWVTKSTKSH